MHDEIKITKQTVKVMIFRKGSYYLNHFVFARHIVFCSITKFQKFILKYANNISVILKLNHVYRITDKTYNYLTHWYVQS